MYADKLPESGNCSALNSKHKTYVSCFGRLFGVPEDNAEVHCCSGNVFQNHPQRNRKRKFHDFLTLANVNRKTVDSRERDLKSHLREQRSAGLTMATHCRSLNYGESLQNYGESLV